MFKLKKKNGFHVTRIRHKSILLAQLSRWAHKVSLKHVHVTSAAAVVVVVVVVHNVQTSSPGHLKPLSQPKPNFMWSIRRKGKRCIK